MSYEPRPHLRVENVSDVTVVHFEDDHINSEDIIKRIGDQLNAILETGEGTKLLLDFTGVRFVSSSMMARLVYLKKKGLAAHGQVKLCGLAPYLRTVFEVSRLDRVLEIYGDEEAALDSFRNEAAHPGTGVTTD